MAIENSSIEGPFSASMQSAEELPAEDLTWAESCLVNNPQISDINWDSVKDALLDVFTSQPQLSDHSAVQNHNRPGETDIEMLFSSHVAGTSDIKLVPSTEEVRTSNAPLRFVDEQLYPFNDVGSDQETDILMSQVLQRDSSEPTFTVDDDNHCDSSNGLFDEEDILMSQVLKRISQPIIGDEFPPKSTDDQNEIEGIDPEVDFISSVIAMEQSTSFIFSVWDLNIPAEEEEDDFTKQLNKALETVHLPNDSLESEALKDLEVESVDDLIAGLAELSL